MKIQKGKAIEELVKGSLEYTRDAITNAFRTQFPYVEGVMTWYSIVDTFADYVVVSAYGELKPDEYYRVPYTRSGDIFTFSAKDQWEVVELAYQPQTVITESKKKNGKRLEERIEASHVTLLEAKNDAKGTRRIRINDFMVADTVNGNKRLYPKAVIEAMVSDWQPYLRESRGQGRLMILAGEVEHPSDKGQKPQFLETIVRWDTLDWNGKNLNIEGDLILTSKGKDVEILMEAGVNPGASIRGIGESKVQKVDGEKVEIVEWVSMNAADLVGDPSFLNVAELQESIKQSSMEDDVDELLKQLMKLREEHPELFAGITEAQLKKMGEDQLKAMEEKIRATLGIDVGANITESLKVTAEKARKFDEGQKKQTIDSAITEATKDLPYGTEGNSMFVEAIRSANPQDETTVKALVESKRKEYDKLFAGRKLEKMGFKPGKIQGVQPVLEAETGTPEFARGAFLLTESFHKVEYKERRDFRKPKSPNEAFTAQLLERFDALYQRHLIEEAKQLEEAELTTDLNLPYSVSRAIIEEAFPDLIAAGIFDVGMINTSPTRLYFETFSGESGYTGTVTDEVVTGGAENTWYALAHGRLTPDSVVVTSNPAGTTYVEGTDYVIDYAAGRIKFLTAGSINTDDVLVDYGYTAIRQGENQPIERGKMTLAFKVIEAAADRLADQISREAVVFSQSQLGYDATARTLLNLAKQMRRKIDQGLLYAAYSAVKAVPSNSTTPWTVATTQDGLDELVRLMGAAYIIVDGRFYAPSFHLMSKVNAERLSHWNGFKRDGFPNAVMAAAGFAGGVNGIPIFAGTEFPSSLIICGNSQLVQHRVLQPMIFKGPFPTYATTGDVTRIVAADQYYAEEFNVTDSPVNEKGAFVPIEEAGS